MEILHVENLVVLMPALAVTVLAVLIHAPAWIRAQLSRLSASLSEAASTREHVESFRDFTVNASFSGSAVGAVVGISSDSTAALLLAAAAFLAGCIVVARVNRLLIAIGQREAKDDLRRTAGLMRSIVRSELSAAAPRVRSAVLAYQVTKLVDRIASLASEKASTAIRRRLNAVARKIAREPSFRAKPPLKPGTPAHKIARQTQ